MKLHLGLLQPVVCLSLSNILLPRSRLNISGLRLFHNGRGAHGLFGGALGTSTTESGCLSGCGLSFTGSSTSSGVAVAGFSTPAGTSWLGFFVGWENECSTVDVRTHYLRRPPLYLLEIDGLKQPQEEMYRSWSSQWRTFEIWTE